MSTIGIMEDIRNLLKEGRPSAEVIAMGYAPSSVYKAQRQLRKASDRTDQPMTQVLVTNMVSESCGGIGGRLGSQDPGDAGI